MSQTVAFLAAMVETLERRRVIAERAHHYPHGVIRQQIACQTGNHFGVFIVYGTRSPRTSVIVNLSGAFACVCSASREPIIYALDDDAPPPAEWSPYPYRSLLDAQRAADDHLQVVTGHTCTSACASWPEVAQ